MKKRLATGYTFDASAQTIVHADFSDITLAGIQLITNVTDGLIIYNFADPAKGGTLSTDTLTLEYDTTSMSDTDELMILVEDGTTTQAVTGTVDLGATDNAVLDAIEADTTTLAGAVYTEGNTDTTITGIPILWEDSGNTLAPVSNSKPLPVKQYLDGAEAAANTGNSNAQTQRVVLASDQPTVPVSVASVPLPTGASTLAEQQAQTTHLATIAGDTTAIETAVQLLDDTVATDGAATPTKGILIAGQDGTNAQTIKTDSDGNLQIDVLTMPSTTVTATDLDIRNLTNTDVVTAELSATDNAVLDAIAASVAAIDTDATTIIGHVDGIETLIGTTNTTLGTIDTDTGAIATSTASIDTKTPALGQALAAASVPVVLTEAQMTTLTPPAAITNFANETGGNLATIASKDFATQTTLAAINAKLVTGTDIGDVTINNTTTTPVPTKELRPAAVSQSTVADTASSTTILASNANRLGATIANDSSAVLYLKLGATASTTSYTVRMAQYGYYEVPFGYTGVIDGIWASDPGDGAARVTELTLS